MPATILTGSGDKNRPSLRHYWLRAKDHNIGCTGGLVKVSTFRITHSTDHNLSRSINLYFVETASCLHPFETAWFDARTRQPTRARQLGPNVVQVRAWVDPSRPGHSKLTVETVYRPLADPSLSPRDLDRQVPPDHPIGKRMTEIVTELAKLYSTEPAPQAPRPR